MKRGEKFIRELDEVLRKHREASPEDRKRFRSSLAARRRAVYRLASYLSGFHAIDDGGFISIDHIDKLVARIRRASADLKDNPYNTAMADWARRVRAKEVRYAKTGSRE